MSLFFCVCLIILHSCNDELSYDHTALNSPKKDSYQQEGTKASKETTKTSIQPPSKPEDKLHPGRPETCGDILEEFKDPKRYLIDKKEFSKAYVLKKDLRSESKSGAFPALVISQRDNNTKFFKLFPPIEAGLKKTDILKDQSYLEIFQSCRLSKLNLAANLPADVPASRFFVDIYDNAFLNAADPFFNLTSSNNKYYPYLIGEAVDGFTLTKFARSPKEAAKIENYGFDLNNAPPMVLESVLMQIIVALKNPYLVWQLVHQDLHTGNILLAKHEKADFYIEFNGKKMPLVGPLVKIIDFGLGASEGFDQEKSFNYSVWIKNRPFIKELEDFIKLMRPDGISLIARTKIGFSSQNQDLYMFNLILRAFKKVLNKRGSQVPEGKYCKDYDDCIDLMSKWWK
ncbi:MAG: hypothetical protein H6731_09535 [Myxococcales bacterium]|nr:MAG: hypothetical protein H6731_09535 [Myxococcales bacterium]